MSLERQVCIPITFQLLRFRQSSGQDFITGPRACQGFFRDEIADVLQHRPVSCNTSWLFSDAVRLGSIVSVLPSGENVVMFSELKLYASSPTCQEENCIDLSDNLKAFVQPISWRPINARNSVL